MRMPIFLKFVIVSLIIALLSLALSTLIFMFYQTLSPAYVFYILIIIIGISFFAAGSFVEPLEKLKAGLESISKGEFKSVDIKTGDELEELAKSFNQMARELIEKKKRLESSEEMYRSLVENINDWVFEVDENFVFTYSSPKVTEILGYSVEEIVGRNIVDLFDEKEKIKEIFDSVGGLKQPFSGFEGEFKTKKGETVYLEISGRPFFDDSGNLKGFRCVGRDITLRKLAEKEMAYFIGVLEHSVDAIVILDLDGKILSWNRGAEMMFGYKAEEIVGKPLSSIMPEENWSSCVENFKKAVLEGHARDIETVRIAKDGRRIIVDQTLTSILDKEGNLIGFVAIMRDVTKKKENEIKLKQAYKQLEEKTKELLDSKKELEYLANIVENSNDAIYSVDLNGIIKSWNKTAESLFGWAKEEAMGMNADKLLPYELRKELEYTISRIKDGTKFMRFETKRVRKDGEIVDVEVTISPILDENENPVGFSVIARDISWKLKAEREVMKKLLKYEIDNGKIYLVDRFFDLALDAFKDLIRCGYSGVIISRKYPEDIGIEGVEYYWLSEKKSKNTVSPDIEKVYQLVMGVSERNRVILLDLDYILIRNGFEEILKFVQKIKDIFYLLKKGVIILVVDPILLKDFELNLLKKECSPIKPKRVELPEEAYELLRYVYMKNRVGERPSIKDVMRKFNITRNTAKRRINYLAEKGMVSIIKDGRLKLLEVTESGREIFV